MKKNSYRVYEAELKREQSLFDQTNRLLIFLSLLATALSAVLPKELENINATPDNEIFRIVAYIIAALTVLLVLVALIFTLLAQWRYHFKIYPDLIEIREFVLDKIDSSYLAEEIDFSYANHYLPGLYTTVRDNNDKRRRHLQIAMYCSLGACGIIIICIFAFLIRGMCGVLSDEKIFCRQIKKGAG